MEYIITRLDTIGMSTIRNEYIFLVLNKIKLYTVLITMIKTVQYLKQKLCFDKNYE